jgi:D-lactate dehydrogenase
MSDGKVKVALYDVHPADESYYREALGQDYQLTITADGLSEATAGQAAGAQVLAVHVTSPVTAQIMARLPHLRNVACRSTGFDHVDLQYAAAHDITVSTVPSYGEHTVAEYAFMLMLAVARQLSLAAGPGHSADAASGPTGHDLSGKTLGVVGTGRIGRHAARIGRGFGMQVVGYDLYPNAAAATDIGFEYLPLDQLLARADYITLHAPGTPETHHLIDARAFAKMKPGVFIVNTARGSLIHTPALVTALESGKVAGAGLDVVEGEEPGVLSRMPQVLITDHNAYNSVEALQRIRETTVANIQAWRAGHATNLVTAPEAGPAPKSP